MAIKAIVDKIEDVEEPFRTLYTEKNGKFELTGVEGMKTQADIDRIQGGLLKERNEHKATKDKFAGLGDRKVEDVIAMLERFPELEAAAEGKLDEKKIGTIVEGRLAAKTGPLERQVKTLTTSLAEAKETIDAFVFEKQTRTIHDDVRAAIGKVQGFQASAMEDALMFSERMLELNTEGKVVTKDNVGVTPGVDAAVWLTEMQQRKPHWWGNSAGGGANGNTGNSGTSAGTNPWSADGWNMTEQAKAFRANPERAGQLAKAAGTTIGGKRPVKK